MRKVTAKLGSTEPTAFVTKGRQRVKQYNNDSTVYLNNGNEFEIELFNPTTSKVMAKIELNGNSIGAGIVLRPGERVFIERYLDEPKKFMFQTYEVNGNNSDVQRAIANNGDVRVLFYKEEVPNYPWYSGGCTWTTTWPTWGTTTYTNTIGSPTFGGPDTTFGDLKGSMYSGSIDYSPASGSACMDSLSNCCDDMSFMSQDLSRSVENSSKLSSKPRGRKMSKSLKASKSVETGRIDKGSVSNQSFGQDYTNFDTYWTWKTEWKILPTSQKAMVSEDIKVFCTHCGARRKRGTHKFCPNCGTKY